MTAALQLTEADWLAIERAACERSLAEFTKQAWHVIEPGTPLIWNWHLDVLSTYIQAFFEGKIKRLIVNVPPGSMKSILFCVTGPAQAWTRNPSLRFVNMTNEMGLATRDSRRMRDVLASDWYQRLWGDRFEISADQREKTNYENTKKGFRISLGFDGNVTGKRGNRLLLDDPVDAKKAFSDAVIESANQTYDHAISSRLNDLDNDCIGLIMQRLRENDLTGHLLKKKSQKWVHVKIAMEYEGEPGYDPVKDLGPEYAHLRDPRTKIGELMFPAKFSAAAVAALKEDLGDYGTAGQLQQRPQPIGGGIIKKHWWQKWEKDKPLPPAIHTFASIDTAFSDKDRRETAYSVRSRWIVFEDESSKKHALLLTGAWWERLDYPSLKKRIRSEHIRDQIDLTLIERKASGISLLQDLKKSKKPRLVVRGFNPGNRDKTERAHLATPMFESGLVYYPEGRKWAMDFVDYVASFPSGAPPSADCTDTVTQAVLYTKQRGWAFPPDEEDMPLPVEELSEEEEEDVNDTPRRRPAYG